MDPGGGEGLRRPADWLRQAERDLAHARRAARDGDHEWACFAAHQAGEKAVKALLQAQGVDAWGHSITYLIRQLPEDLQPRAELIEEIKDLDRHYVAPRYPDAYPEGAPLDYYTRAMADAALRQAEALLAHVRKGLSSGGA